MRPGEIPPKSPRGRGAAANPTGRFERLAYEPDDDERDAEAARAAGDPGAGPARLTTELYRDSTRGILASNQSPDLGFDTSLNPYRGCEHGCSYCYARPTHEYLGLSAGLDFESKIFVKTDAPELLQNELERPSWRPRVIALSGVTDPYQPAERGLRLTRRCLEVLAAFRNPVTIVTKSALVARDVDLLGELARHGAVSVAISLTSLDPLLQRRLEPRASRPDRRLAAMRALRDAGVPVTVMTAPVVPGLNDAELPKILRAAAEQGARSAGFVMLRLPHGVKALFADWLARHYPERREKVLHLVAEMRGGQLDDSRFGSRLRGEGPYADQIRALFQLECRRNGLATAWPALRTDAFRVPGRPAQLGLFGGVRESGGTAPG